MSRTLRRLRSPEARAGFIGVLATIVIALVFVIVLLLAAGGKAVSDNAALIGALVALGGVVTTQRVNITLEAQRAKDSALQAFLDQLSHSDTYIELRTAAASGHKRAVLRAKIQTLLLQLDEERKGVLLSFLHGAKLSRREEITPHEHTKEESEKTRTEPWRYPNLRSEKTRTVRWRYPILRLDYIDFSRTKRTPDTKLTFDDLESIILRGAKLNEVNLSGANLRNADLRDADLSYAQLRKANQHDSEEIPGEYFNEYRKAIRGRSASELLETDLILETDLSEANLSRANLNGANLSCANLSKANLRYADLRGADLSGAYKMNSDGSNRKLVANEELEQQAKSLQGATMPNGQKYEDWLKSKDRK
jgi:uncharacterized protein YjbI with pentapeptide repeats